MSSSVAHSGGLLSSVYLIPSLTQWWSSAVGLFGRSVRACMSGVSGVSGVSGCVAGVAGVAGSGCVWYVCGVSGVCGCVRGVCGVRAGCVRNVCGVADGRVSAAADQRRRLGAAVSGQCASRLCVHLGRDQRPASGRERVHRPWRLCARPSDCRLHPLIPECVVYLCLRMVSKVSGT